ncbi:MAG: HEAT repeat domain-containing protein [Bryobacterales bacterium]|nr:HEAT repeat domain-containing protein [Bryobacterales bacterium]
MARFSSVVLIWAVLAPGRMHAETSRSDFYWSILDSAVESGGPDASRVFALLGTIDDERARDLLRRTLGAGSSAIGDAASGLTPDECRLYLKDLRLAALNPALSSKLAVLSAIARAGTASAAEALLEIADAGSQPAAGVALGFLEQFGSLAEPELKKEAVSGSTPWGRETAAAILDRERAHGAVSVFETDLHDENRNVRIAGALGLAHEGLTEGKAVLESAAKDKDSSYEWDALVGLADLGEADAFREIASVISDTDESTRGRLVWAMARCGNNGVKALAYRLNLPAKPEFLSMMAQRMLQPTDPQDLNTLKGALARCNDPVAMIAAEKLLHTRFREAAQNAVLCGISSTDPQARGLAVDLASRDSTLWPSLASKVNDSDLAVQVAALTAIEHLDQKERFNDVERCIESGNWQVAVGAAKVLAALDPSEARIVYERELHSGRDSIKILSAAMLLKLSR